jgi:hypothetical protein
MFKTLLTPKHLDEIYNVYKPVYDSLNVVQKEIVWDPAKFKIIQGVRRSGKTRIIVSTALLHAICAGPKRILIVTHNNQMIDIIKKELYTLYETVKTDVTVIFGIGSHGVKFSNNSTIEIRSISSFNYKSYVDNYDLVLMDEAALYGKNIEPVHTAWNYLRSSPEIYIVSTRVNRSKKNFFWNIWLNAVLGNNKFKAFKMSLKDCKLMTKDTLSNLKQSMSRAKYDTEFTIRWK